MRFDGRKYADMRQLKISRSHLKFPEGSALIELGDTIVLCTASVEDKVPPFLKGQSQGWITAEYAMLPRSTETRIIRERNNSNARNLEIQRLIGRSLRSVIDLSALGERTIWLDCDVLQADGGTRTAAISGAFIALIEAIEQLRHRELITNYPVRDYLSAVSVGIMDNNLLIDLSYIEDSQAAVDMNVIMAASGKLVEIQGSAEKALFDRSELDQLLDLATTGIQTVTQKQKEVLGPDIQQLIALSIDHYSNKNARE